MDKPDLLVAALLAVVSARAGCATPPDRTADAGAATARMQLVVFASDGKPDARYPMFAAMSTVGGQTMGYHGRE